MKAVITIEQLVAIYKCKKSVAEKFITYLNKYMLEYEITTKSRIQMFLAQIGHESARFVYTEEIASGKAYEGRKDLGNTQVGDGIKFKGRGLIQITGRNNYTEISKAWGIDFINNPKLLSTPEYAVKSACWWWNKRGLNKISDLGTDEAFKRVTKIINGGYNGLTDRLSLFNKSKKIIK